MLTKAQQDSLDMIRSSCIDLSNFLIENLKIMIHNWKSANDHREKGTPLEFIKVKRYPNEPQEEKKKTAEDSESDRKVFDYIFDLLRWLASTLSKVFAASVCDVKPQWVSYSLPPAFGEQEDNTDYDRLRKYNEALRGITGRYIISLNELLERIQGDDKVLLDCYRSLQKIRRSLGGNEWTKLLKLFKRCGIQAPINPGEIEDLKLGGIPLYLKKSIRRFPPVDDFKLLYKMVKTQSAE